MKILVISDIHANLTALEAILAAAGEVEAVWCLGDLVGYGPDANECVERVQSLPNFLCVRGNHDAAVSGSHGIDKFNDEAGDAIVVTRKMLSIANLAFLRALPETLETDHVTLAHGSPRNPVWEYVLDSYTALSNFKFITTQYGIVGHSHLPLMFTFDPNSDKVSRRLIKPGKPVHLAERCIFNPGSVGQPRDNDPRASCGLYKPEEGTWQILRVEYDIASVQQRILKAGLPEKHAIRLSQGW